jgi:glucuronokinase
LCHIELAVADVKAKPDEARDIMLMSIPAARLPHAVYARYESIDPELLPPLWLIYAINPSDSGAVHSDVRRRWKQGDPDVVAAMAKFADIAQQGR